MSRELRIGSLFAGIGGFDLGLARAGMRTVWFCESDPYCRAVLAHHWPAVPVYGDVRTLRGDQVEPVEVLCGGFPCQDLSYAGQGAGIDGGRSGLWAHFGRLIGELRPDWVLVENVAALLARGLGRVLADLAALGYDAEWDCIPASAVGAPHRRDRVWLVAYPASIGLPASGPSRGRGPGPQNGRADVADAQQPRPQGSPGGGQPGERWPDGELASIDFELGRQWHAEPGVGRVADGVPARVDRLRALGNALVPQVAELIGRRIVAYEAGAGEPVLT